MEILFDIIRKNEYVKNCKSKKNKNIYSLSYLINKELSHSDCIKLGIGLEKVICETIIKLTKLENIKSKITLKGENEKDFLFKDDINKIIYYAEFKTNINLDTEKLPKTIEKIKKIANEMKVMFKDYKIISLLVSGRFLNKDDIPKSMFKKYSSIKDNIVGINEYFKILNVDFKFTEDTYKEYLNYLANTMFDSP